MGRARKIQGKRQNFAVGARRIFTMVKLDALELHAR